MRLLDARYEATYLCERGLILALLRRRQPGTGRRGT